MASIFDVPKYRTEIERIDIPLTIDYDTSLLFLGSCFVETIGGITKQLGFDSVINPFGTLYNPASIYDTLKRIAEDKEFELSDLYKTGDTYFSYATNTAFRHTDAEQLQTHLNETLHHAHRHFVNTKVLFVTLGTAFVFRLLENQQIVANCQKQPTALFSHELLTLDAIKKYLREIIRLASPLTVVFTVSPIRHLKNGLVGNARSKALLLTAIHEVINDKTAFYFPSYEMMLDDLRDYRYYDASLVHLSETAKQYVFSQFADTFFSEETQQKARQIEKENKRNAHRSVNKINR